MYCCSCGGKYNLDALLRRFRLPIFIFTRKNGNVLLFSKEKTFAEIFCKTVIAQPGFAYNNGKESLFAKIVTEKAVRKGVWDKFSHSFTCHLSFRLL